MSKQDVFSDLDWGDLSRYQDQNDQAVLAQRVSALAQTIEQLRSEEKTVAWAHKTVERCTAERSRNGDLLEIDGLGQRLDALQAQAEQCIRTERERIAAENRRQARQLEERIHALVDADRDADWCRRVKATNTAAKKLSEEILALVKNSAVLQELLKEAAIVSKAVQLEGQLQALLAEVAETDAWQQAAEALLQQVTPQLRPYLPKKQLAQLQMAVLRAQRKPQFAPYEKCLLKIESGSWRMSTDGVTLKRLNKKLAKLEFPLEECIENFEARWAAALDTLERETKRMEAEAAAQAEALKEQQTQNMLAALVDALERIEKTGAKDAQDRSTFEREAAALGALPFSPEEYVPGFTVRWAAAQELVRLEDAREKERQAAAKREKAEQERLAQMEKLRQALLVIEHNGAADQDNRRAFTEQDHHHQSLRFSTEDYEPGFEARWEAARALVQQEEDRLAEELERQRAKEARAEKGKERLAAVGSFLYKYRKELLRFLPGFVIITAAMIYGYNYVAGLGQNWYGVLIAGSCALFAVQAYGIEKRSIRSLNNLLLLGVLLLEILILSLIYQFSFTNIAIAFAVVSAIFVCYPQIGYVGRPIGGIVQGLLALAFAAYTIYSVEVGFYAKALEYHADPKYNADMALVAYILPTCLLCFLFFGAIIRLEIELDLLIGIPSFLVIFIGALLRANSIVLEVSGGEITHPFSVWIWAFIMFLVFAGWLLVIAAGFLVGLLHGELDAYL